MANCTWILPNLWSLTFPNSSTWLLKYQGIIFRLYQNLGSITHKCLELAHQTPSYKQESIYDPLHQSSILIKYDNPDSFIGSADKTANLQWYFFLYLIGPICDGLPCKFLSATSIVLILLTFYVFVHMNIFMFPIVSFVWIFF